MPTKRWPRRGSMGVWHRKRAKRIYPRIKAWPNSKDAKLLGFAGFKVGMTHIFVADNRKTSATKGEEISLPVTILECPPIKIAALQLYKKTPYGLKLTNTVWSKVDKELSRKLALPKKVDEKAIEQINPEEYADIRALAYTQPKLTGIGKKKPDLFEIAIGGKPAEQLEYAKSVLGKEVQLKDTFSPGDLIDIHAVTKGKGLQGVVKRFGVKIRSHKSEKKIRGAVIGPEGYAKVRFSAPQAGQVGYHNRVQYNKPILKIGEKPEEVNCKGGFLRYGLVKSNYLLVKGSIQGPAKRIIRFKKALRPTRDPQWKDVDIRHISTDSKQGR